MNPEIHRPAARLALAFLLSVGSATAAAAQNEVPGHGDPVPLERPVSYTRDQADRGQDRYLKDCEECHGKDLKGGLNGGAPLRGLAFLEKYADGAPASVMFWYMSNEMPPNAPGRYSESTYADLMAYILKRNGFRSGEPLPADLDALDLVIVEK